MKTAIFVLLIAVLGISIAKKKHRSDTAVADDWDKLEQLLRKAEKMTKNNLGPDGVDDRHDLDNVEALEHPIDVQTQRMSSSDVDDANRPNLPSAQNPCENHRCNWGKECILNENGLPSCECAKKCPEVIQPDAFDKACSNQNETFDSICHLYRERCLCKHEKEGCLDPRHRSAHLEYLGQCKELEPCTDSLISQFPSRMADWLFQVMRDLKKRQELHGDDWIRMIEEAESDDHLKHVYPVIWKFCELDVKPHDSAVTHHELIPVTAPVMPMESCIKPFLKGCDANSDELITLREWGKCLGLQEEEIQEKC